MATPLGSDIEARITQVLQDFMPAELDLIDTQRGGALATPDVPNGNYRSGPRPLVDDYPAITINLERYSEVEVSDAELSTGRLRYDAHVKVGCHVQAATDADGTPDINRMRDLAERYLAAIVRILRVKKTGLQTSASNIRFAETTLPDGDWTPIEAETQSSGLAVRSVTVPIIVRMSENL